MEQYPFKTGNWLDRYAIISNLIGAHESVLDLGGGQGNLKKYIKAPKKYIIVDKYPLPEVDIVADFNFPETYPDFQGERFGIVVCSGLLEYLQKSSIEMLFKKLHEYSDHVIFSHYERDIPLHLWENNLTHQQISEIRLASGWDVIKTIPCKNPKQLIYYCQSNL